MGNHHARNVVLESVRNDPRFLDGKVYISGPLPAGMPVKPERTSRLAVVCRDPDPHAGGGSDGETLESTRIEEDIDSLFSYLNGFLDEDHTSGSEVGRPDEKKHTLSSVPEVDETCEDYSDIDSFPSSNTNAHNTTHNFPPSGTSIPVYAPVVKPPRKGKENIPANPKRPKMDLPAAAPKISSSMMDLRANGEENHIYAKIVGSTNRLDERNDARDSHPLRQSAAFNRMLDKQQITDRNGVRPNKNAIYRRPSFEAPKSQQALILEEGTVVQSTVSFSNPNLPGTLAFVAGQTGMVMRSNTASGWFYVSLRTGEGWAPADYWQKAPISPTHNFLTRKNWYFGFVTRPDCEFLLMRFGEEGDFLVRNSTVRENEFTLSMRYVDSVRHFAVRMESPHHFFIGKLSYRFDSMDSIIRHYQKHTILSDAVAYLGKPFSFQF